MFTLTNLASGDLSFGPLGTVPRGRTLSVKYISPEVRAAKVKGLISISPTGVTSVPAASGITNVMASYAVTSIVDPSSTALARANDATLAEELIKLRNDFESLRAYVEANVRPGTN